MLTLSSISRAATLTVTSTADSGAGSLRQAILDAASNDTIRFSLPANSTITLTTGSLLIVRNVNIIGPGANLLTITRSSDAGTPPFRIFSVTFVGSVLTVNFSGLTIANGNPVGGVAGGIFNDRNNMNITSCTISGNSAVRGGGIYNEGTMTIAYSTISGNISSGSTGGGIYNYSTLNIINSTISGNTSLQGGGIFNNDTGTTTITNGTITGNTATSTEETSGGGIYNFGGTVTGKDTIIAGNMSASTLSPDYWGVFASQGWNLIGNTNNTSITGATTGNQLNVNPMLGPLAFNGRTRTHALLPGSPAIDKGNSALLADQRPFNRPFDYPAISNPGNGADIGAFERTPAFDNPAFDFDGDGKTDISIFRPSVGEWWYLKSSNGGNAAAQFGAGSDIITPGDFTGDGKTDIAFWRPSTGFWFVLRSEDFSFYSFPFGTSGDIPTVGDFDGDGKTDATIFRPSAATWYISRSQGGTTIQQFGANGDAPVAADYDGDNLADIAIFRPSVGEWWIQRSSNATTFALQFGSSTDKPIQGDFTGDGKADIAFWRPSTGFWFVLRSEDFSFYAFPFGISTDIPAPGDFDGDGKFDAAVFRPSDTNWYIQRSTAGTLIQQFGISGDRPVPNAFVP